MKSTWEADLRWKLACRTVIRKLGCDAVSAVTSADSMEISEAQWKKKIKRWLLFTWHMVPGLEGVCGGVDRTVYGALGT